MPDESKTPPEGLLLVDKPAGWTSHDAVARVRRLAGTKKVGHAGTLDPMATGLLVLGIGRATKLLTYVVGADKRYTGTIRLGSTTPTDDAESDAEAIAPPEMVRGVSDRAIEDAVGALTGTISQVPSAVSAIKVNGVRSYKRVRDGENVTPAARDVTIRRFDILSIRRPGDAIDDAAIDIDVIVDCTSGTYIRALARDLGHTLGVGGHLTALRRLSVGGFEIADAVALPGWDEPGARPETLPMAEAASQCLPVRCVTDDEARALGFGQWISASAADGPTAAISEGGMLVAIIDNARGRAKPVVGFPR